MNNENPKVLLDRSCDWKDLYINPSEENFTYENGRFEQSVYFAPGLGGPLARRVVNNGDFRYGPQFTVACWVNLSNLHPFGGGSSNIFELTTNTGLPVYAFGVDASGFLYIHLFRTSANGKLINSQAMASKPPALPRGQWARVVYQVDVTNPSLPLLTMRVNSVGGTLETNPAWNVSPNRVAENARTGRIFVPTGSLVANLDELMVWNRNPKINQVESALQNPTSLQNPFCVTQTTTPTPTKTPSGTPTPTQTRKPDIDPLIELTGAIITPSTCASNLIPFCPGVTATVRSGSQRSPDNGYGQKNGVIGSTLEYFYNDVRFSSSNPISGPSVAVTRRGNATQTVRLGPQVPTLYTQRTYIVQAKNNLGQWSNQVFIYGGMYV
jgi:hypothetical protein